MQQIVVRSSDDIRNIINQLRSCNREFEDQMRRQDNEEGRLDAMWDGNANEAFNTVYRNDRKHFWNFSQAIKDYINALENILRQYEDSEQKNVNTARTRSI